MKHFVRTLTVLAVGTIMSGAAACSSGTTSERQPFTPTTQPTQPRESTPAPGKGRSQNDALAAYQGMWQDFAAAGETSDWQSPQLGQHATGVALTNLSRGLYADHYNGLVTKGAPVLAPHVTAADEAGSPSKVTITDCGDSTHWLKYRADNGQLSDTAGGRRLINAIVEQQSDGSWKVTDFAVHDIGTC